MIADKLDKLPSEETSTFRQQVEHPSYDDEDAPF